MSKNEDTGARLAAIKDIPTERLIELAQAEAAGLVTISTSPADIYSQAVTIAAAPRDGDIKKRVIWELERLSCLDIDLAKGTIGTRKTVAVVKETLPFLRVAAAMLRKVPASSSNKPLFPEELQELDGKWVWLETADGKEDIGWGFVVGKRKKILMFDGFMDFRDCGKEFVAYLRRREQEPEA